MKRFASPATLAAALLLGCASAPSPRPPPQPVDPWAAYVGRWTVQEALAQLGPPTHTSPAGAGLTLYEWTVQYQGQVVTGLLSFYGQTNSPGPVYVTGPSTRTALVKCTFDANGRLTRGQTFDQ